MAYSKLLSKIIPTKLKNTGSCDTIDHFYIDSADKKVKDLAYATDFALTGNVFHPKDFHYFHATSNLQPSTTYLLRDSGTYVDERSLVCSALNEQFLTPNYDRAGLKVCTRLKLADEDDIEYLGRKIDYEKHTINLGEYPQSQVDKNFAEILGIKLRNGELEPNRVFNRLVKKPNSEEFHLQPIQTYKFWGKKYARVNIITSPDQMWLQFSKSRLMHKSDFCREIWLKVEPVKFKINNWDYLPKKINHYGNGTANCLNLTSEQVIIGQMPKIKEWHNSYVRNYLNVVFAKELLFGNEQKAEISLNR